VLALVLAAMLQAAPAAAEPAKEPAPKPPASIANAVDANGVPAWAKRKRLHPVQACETKPNIGVETWRQRYDSTGRDRPKLRTPTAVCH
jgi:hypothetical protein